MLQQDWHVLSAKLTAGRDGASTELRLRLFNRMDINANGFLLELRERPLKLLPVYDRVHSACGIL